MTVGSLVRLIDNEDNDLLYYILPVAAGLAVSTTTKEDTLTPRVTVVTPKSPLGQLVLGAELDDELCIPFGKNRKTVWIAQIS